MTLPHPTGDDAKLGALLRGARPAPELPLRFQEQVWRRIEASESDETPFAWLDACLNRLWRPRFAVSAVALLILMGMVAGTHEGKQDVRQSAQARYVASVAPSILQ